MNRISFNTHTEHNYYTPTVTEFDKDATMTSADGFILSGGSYVAVFSDGVDSFTITIPNTVTGTSLYYAVDFASGFDATYTIMIDGYPFGQWIFDGYGTTTNFTLLVTSLSGGRITASFSGVLALGTYETIYAYSTLTSGTLTASIGD